MDSVMDIINSLNELEKQEKENVEKGIACVVLVSDDDQEKVAVIKSRVPRVYEIMKINSINDLADKEKIKQRIKVYGKKKTAETLDKILSGEIEL